MTALPAPSPLALLLPGLACDDELLAPQAQALRALGLAVHTPDVHTREASLPAMAQALLAELPPDVPLLPVGASMGGMLALHLHRLAPARVAGIALLGTTARADTPELVALRTQACELFAQGRMDEVLRANVPFAFHPSHTTRQDLVGTYLAMIRRAGAAQLIRQNQAVMARPDLRAYLPQVDCPVLVLCGQADALTPPEHSQEMAAALPRARLLEVGGAGHLLTLEQPAAVNDALCRWVREHGWAGSPAA